MNGVVDTTKIFANVIQQGAPGTAGTPGPQGDPGPQGPPGPADTSSISLAQVAVDLDEFKTVIDDDIGETFITDNSRPADPQYTYTVLAGQVPASADIADYMVFLTLGGQNTDSVDHIVNWHLTLNGVEISDVSGQTSGTLAGEYWCMIGLIASIPTTVGDVIGLKIWTDSSSLVTFAYASLYIVPQTLSVPSGFQTISNGSNYTQNVVAGDLVGIAYGEAANTYPSFFDSVAVLKITGSVPPTLGLFTFAKPIQVIHAGPGGLYKEDVNTINVGNSTVFSQLLSISAGSLVKIIQNYDFIVGAPTFAGTPIFTELIGAIDGTDGSDGNAIFTLPQIPLDPAQLIIMNQVLQIQGGLPRAYTYSLVAGVPTITFNVGFIPIVDDQPMAQYFY